MIYVSLLVGWIGLDICCFDLILHPFLQNFNAKSEKLKPSLPPIRLAQQSQAAKIAFQPIQQQLASECYGDKEWHHEQALCSDHGALKRIDFFCLFSVFSITL